MTLGSENNFIFSGVILILFLLTSWIVEYQVVNKLHYFQVITLYPKLFTKLSFYISYFASSLLTSFGGHFSYILGIIRLQRINIIKLLENIDKLSTWIILQFLNPNLPMVKSDQGTKLLHLMRPAIAVIPEIQQAPASVTIESKQIWTAIVVLIYLLCCQIPLYGIIKDTGADPFYWMRVILASNKGSLMELGISPLVTSSMIMQLLAGAKLIKVDQNVRQEKELFEGAQKLIGIFIAFGQAFAYTWSGMYGPLDTIGAGNAILIILQLTFASVITMLLDDIMTKGYGIGNSGTSLFIAINMAETVVWSCFSPISYKVNEQSTEQYEGTLIEFFYGLIFKRSIVNALFRSTFTNITNLLATALVFLIVIFFQGFQVTLRLSNNKSSTESPYSIKLFYTSNIPIILQTALVSNLYFFSQMLYKNFKGSFITNIFGNWQDSQQGQLVPVGGLIYYITSPRSLLEALRDPIHTVIYIVFIIGICALFSRTWIEVSGQGPKEVASKLKEEGMFLKGHTNDGTYRKLKQLILTAATLGGICIGLLTIFADFLGAIGSGTGILLTVNIIYSLYEQIVKNKAKNKKR